LPILAAIAAVEKTSTTITTKHAFAS